MEINDLLKNTNSKDIKKLIALLQIISDAQESDNEIEESDREEKIDKSVKSATKKNNNKKLPKIQQARNKFLDMPESKMHKEDCSLDKKLMVQPPVPRERYFDPVSVTCRVCGKTELLSPNLIDNSSRYKCNKCSTNPG